MNVLQGIQTWLDRWFFSFVVLKGADFIKAERAIEKEEGLRYRSRDRLWVRKTMGKSTCKISRMRISSSESITQSKSKPKEVNEPMITPYHKLYLCSEWSWAERKDSKKPIANTECNIQTSY